MTSKSARGVARTSTRCLGLQMGSKNSVWLCKEKVRFRALGSTPILHTDTPNLSLTPTTPLHYTNTLNDMLTPTTPPSPFRLPLSSFRVGRTTTLLKMDLGKFGVVCTTMYFHCGVPNAFSHFSVQYRCLAETIPETSPSNRDGGRDVPTLGSTWEVFNWEVLKGTKGFALFPVESHVSQMRIEQMQPPGMYGARGGFSPPRATRSHEFLLLETLFPLIPGTDL